MIPTPSLDPSRSESPHAALFTRWGGWLAFLLLSGQLVFCHGCHGEEDNELCVPPRITPRQHDAKQPAPDSTSQQKTLGKPRAG